MESQELKRCLFGVYCLDKECQSIHLQNLKSASYIYPSLLQSASIGKNCINGWKCGKIYCEFSHPHQNNFNFSQNEFEEEEVFNSQQIPKQDINMRRKTDHCKVNKECKDEDCEQFHNTITAQSPVFVQKLLDNEQLFMSSGINFKQEGFQLKFSAQLQGFKNWLQRIQKKRYPQVGLQLVEEKIQLTYQEFKFELHEELKSISEVKMQLEMLFQKYSSYIIESDFTSEMNTVKVTMDQYQQGWQQAYEVIKHKINEISQRIILLPDFPNYALKYQMYQHKNEMFELQNDFGIKITLSPTFVRINKRDKVVDEVVTQKMQEIIQKAQADLSIIHIKDIQMIEMYDKLTSNKINLQKDCRVRVMKIIDGYIEPEQKNYSTPGQDFDQINVDIRSIQWAYQIGTDTMQFTFKYNQGGDFEDFDEGQNQTIEEFFQDCWKKRDFTKRLQIGIQTANQLCTFDVVPEGQDANKWYMIREGGFEIIALKRRIIKKQEFQQSSLSTGQLQKILLKKQFAMQVQGTDSSIKQFEQYLQQAMEDSRNYYESADVRGLTKRQIRDIIEIIVKLFQVQVSQGSEHALQIQGFKSKDASLLIESICDQITTYNYPDSWEDLISMLVENNQCMTRLLAQNQLDYLDVISAFKTTSSTSYVCSIERIQNLDQWKFYSFQKNSKLPIRNGQATQELYLFYGPRKHDPYDIVQSQEGVIGNQTNELFHYVQGSGDQLQHIRGKIKTFLYLTQNSIHSQSTAWKQNDGRQQMFLARVLLGNCLELEKTAPLQKYYAAPIMDQQSGKRYDSVQLTYQDDSKAYIVFKNQCVYPEYLITYQEQ